MKQQTTFSRTHWSVFSFNKTLNHTPYQHLLYFNDFNFVHTSSQVLFQDLAGFKKTLQLHPTRRSSLEGSRLNPLFNFKLRAKLWYLFTARRFSFLKNTKPVLSKPYTSSMTFKPQLVPFSLRSDLLHATKYAIQGVYFPLYNRELRLDNRWQQKGLSYGALYLQNTLMFSDKKGVKNVKIRKVTLIKLLRSILTHLTPLLRTQVLESDGLRWDDLLLSTLKNNHNQFKALKPSVKPKRAFNWFRERPYLFLNRRPSFEAKLDWILHSTLFETFLLYKNSLKRFKLHQTRRDNSVRLFLKKSNKRSSLLRRLKKQRFRNLSYFSAITKTPRFLAGGFSALSGNVCLPVKVRIAFLNSNITVNRFYKYSSAVVTQPNTDYFNTTSTVLAPNLTNVWFKVSRLQQLLTTTYGRTLSEVYSSNLSVLKESLSQQDVLPYSNFWTLPRKLRGEIPSYKVLRERVFLEKPSLLWETSNYVVRRLFGKTPRIFNFLNRSVYKRLYFRSVIGLSGRKVTPYRTGVRWSRKVKRHLRQNLFLQSLIPHTPYRGSMWEVLYTLNGLVGNNLLEGGLSSRRNSRRCTKLAQLVEGRGVLLWLLRRLTQVSFMGKGKKGRVKATRVDPNLPGGFVSVLNKKLSKILWLISRTMVKEARRSTKFRFRLRSRALLAGLDNLSSCQLYAVLSRRFEKKPKTNNFFLTSYGSSLVEYKLNTHHSYQVREVISSPNYTVPLSRTWLSGFNWSKYLRPNYTVGDASRPTVTTPIFYSTLKKVLDVVTWVKPTKFFNDKSNCRSKLWLYSSHNLPFILNSYAFTYVTRVNDPACNTFLGSHFPVFKYRKHMHSFLYLNEIKRYILHRHRVTIKHFENHRFGNFEKVNTFKKYLYHYRRTKYLTLRQPSSGQYFKARIDRSFKARESGSVHVRRVRFKPGYSRIWRNVRTALKESLNLSFRYQHRLTAYLPRFYKLSKFQSLYGLEMRLSSILIYTNLVPDYEFSKYFIESGLVFVNGFSINRSEALIVLNDFIQLVVSLKYYIAKRWLNSWKIKKHLRLKKLSNAKYNNQSRRRLDKQVSTRLPGWLYQHKYKYYDVPNYLEVDYFTLSAFMIYDPFLSTDFNPTNSREFRVSIYKNYNWKYIT